MHPPVGLISSYGGGGGIRTPVLPSFQFGLTNYILIYTFLIFYQYFLFRLVE